MSLQRRFKKPVPAVAIDTRQSTALEKHYSPAEVASMWGLSDDSVRSIFRDDPRVLRIGSREPHKEHGEIIHGYVSLRIPESVVKEIYEPLRMKGRAGLN